MFLQDREIVLIEIVPGYKERCSSTFLLKTFIKEGAQGMHIKLSEDTKLGGIVNVFALVEVCVIDLCIKAVEHVQGLIQESGAESGRWIIPCDCKLLPLQTLSFLHPNLLIFFDRLIDY